MSNLKKFGVKLGLENIKKAASLFENPQNNYKSVHIGGTNGKGSTAKILSSLLSNNYSVGLYTSPHLKKINERIQINGQEISDTEFKKYVEKTRKVLEKNNIELTYFEFITLLAFVYFSDKKVDFVIIEVGLGGRFDATNILSPELCIITNISFDHQKHLGKSLEEIAFEKAGIIKATTITSENKKSILKLFKEKNFPVIKPSCKVISLDNSIEKQKILFDCEEFIKEPIKIKLLGKHQTKNISIALEALKQLNIRMKPKEIIKILNNISWEGRLQRLNKNLFVDGAHNAEGMNALSEFVKEIPKRDLLVIGIANDKNTRVLLSIICPLFERVIFTEASFKPTPAKKLAEQGKKYCKKFEIIPDIRQTIEKTNNVEDFSLVTGSLYMVGDFLKEVNK